MNRRMTSLSQVLCRDCLTVLHSGLMRVWRSIRAGLFLVLAAQLQAGHPCASCHPREVDRYAQSAMAHSISTEAPQPVGEFQHVLSQSRIIIRRSKGKLEQGLVTADGLSVQYPVAYAVGSGEVGFSFLVWLDR